MSSVSGKVPRDLEKVTRTICHANYHVCFEEELKLPRVHVGIMSCNGMPIL